MDGFEACDRIYEYLCGTVKLNHFRIEAEIRKRRRLDPPSLNRESGLKPVYECPVFIFALTQDSNEETLMRIEQHPFICAYTNIDLKTTLEIKAALKK